MNMKKAWWFLPCLLWFGMGGCLSSNMAVKTIKHVRLCKNACQARYDRCRPVCRDCQQCRRKANGNALRHYRSYVHEQSVQGKSIARELQSYRDPLQCRKTTCNCWADLNVCMQSCTGVIRKRLQVASACC